MPSSDSLSERPGKTTSILDILLQLIQSNVLGIKEIMSIDKTSEVNLDIMHDALTALDLSKSRDINDDTVLLLISKFPHLTSISFAGRCSLTPKIAQSFKGLKHLQSVDFSSCHQLATKEIIEELEKNCPNLTSISFAYCGILSDEKVETLAKKFPNLTDVDFIGCKKLTSKSLETLAENCKELTGLGFNLTKFYDQTNELNYKQLNYKQLIDVLKKFKQLKNLRLDYFYQKLSDQVIDLILINCPNLESITTSENAVTKQILQGEDLKKRRAKLTELNLNDVISASMTDAEFIEMAKQIRRLEKIDVSGSRLITEKSLNSINLQHLTDIKLGYVDKKMLEQLTGCKELEVLHFSACDSKIDGVIDKIIINCPKLKSITMSDGKTLQEKEIQQRRAELISRPTLVATDPSGVATDLAQASRYRG